MQFIRKCCYRLCTNKSDNPNVMEKFLKTPTLPKLSQEEIENLNKPKTSKEIELIVKKLSTEKRPGTNGVTGEFYQMFK